jgi:thioredoxin reductase (NADPH)
MAAEAIHAGMSKSRILVIEKEEAHSWSIRKFYPEEKLVTANYKGHKAICHGVVCLSDMSKGETLSYLDQIIKQYEIQVSYKNAVHSISKKSGHFDIFAGDNHYTAHLCVIAIGIFGRPNRPDYAIASELRDRVHFDITSRQYQDSNILIVGGGDSASEYCQYLIEKGNRLTLSYRKHDFSRMNLINQKALSELMQQKKINLLLGTNILGLEDDQGKAVKVNFEAVESISYDHVIYALGGSTPENFLKVIGIEFEGGKPILKEGMETSVAGLFLIGDLSSDRRGGSIVTAFNSAHEAMKKVKSNYMNGNP